MPTDDLRLSRIDTLWSVVQRAHGVSGEKQPAQQILLERYGGAVRRYLLASLRDADAADDVFQEFSLRFVRGDFKTADPDRGRFRSFVKTSLFHLIVDYQRRRKRGAKERAVLGQIPEPHEEIENSALAEETFAQSWREELLSRAWHGLRRIEETEGKPYHTVLRLRVDCPDLRSGELAERLSEQFGRPIQAGAVRVMIHRSREAFSDLLLDAVADSLETGCWEHVEEELIELNLLDYCRPALQRRAE